MQLMISEQHYDLSRTNMHGSKIVNLCSYLKWHANDSLVAVKLSGERIKVEGKRRDIVIR